MDCSSCGAEAIAGQKFCIECGAVLAAICPACGHGGPAGAKFCMECGSNLTAPPPASPDSGPADRAAVPERRLVSVLFADLAGFTAFSEGRDPEDVRAMLTSYFDRSRTVVERYSGNVDKFIGDALMAVWGAPEAHEDDAERATRAGLELVAMVGELGEEIGVPGLQLRVGLLTGETSVGPGGNEKGLVVGDLVNTASRLQSIAEPGTVFVGEATYRLVKHVVEFTSMGEHDLRGKAERVPVYRADRVIAGYRGRRRAETVEPPFVGREEELRLLKDQLHAAARERRSRLVSIIGEAGIGKTRLAWEMFKYVDGLPETTYWHRGRSPAYGEGLTFWSLGEMVRQRAGIAESDEAAKSLMKLRTALTEYVPDEEERRWLEQWLAGLLGLDGLPDGERSELFAAVRTLFHRVADLGQTVLVFEDLHWADPGVLDFVEDLIDRSQRHPILVVTLARPEILEGRPGWGSGRSATAVRLPPLSDGDMADLITGTLPGIPGDAVGALVERAAGVPLYAVEFIRMLLASGDAEPDGEGFRLKADLADLALPDSLQAVIGARLDRLEPADRSLVQDAGVLGQSFTIDGLRALRSETVEELEARMLGLTRQDVFEIEDDPRSPERGNYVFVQSVVREVAYGRLSRGDRYAAHQKVAGYFAGFDVPELAGAVAGHLMAARDAAPEDEREALAGRALDALREAAERAAALHSDAQVLSLCEHAQEIAGDDAARVPFWMLAARAADALADPESGIDLARRALAACETADDEPGRLAAATLVASIQGGSYFADRAVAELRPVYERLEELDSPEAVELAAEMGRALMLSQQPADAVPVCDRALAAAEPREMTRTVIDTLITKGTSLGRLRQPMEAILLLEGAVDLAEHHDHPALAMRALNNLGVILGQFDQHRRVEVQSDLLDKARRHGDLRWFLTQANNAAGDLVRDGRFDEMLEIVGEVRVEPMPEFWERTFDFRELQEELIRRPSPEVFRRAREALAYYDPSTDPQLRPIIDLFKSELDLVAGDWEEAYRRAREVHRSFPSFAMWEVWIMIRAAAWLRDPGRVAETADVFERLELIGPLAAALRSMLEGVGRALAGDREAAAAAFMKAADLLRRYGDAEKLFTTLATFAALVGQDHPEAAAAAREAQEWALETRANCLRQVYADGMPPPATDAAGTAG